MSCQKMANIRITFFIGIQNMQSKNKINDLHKKDGNFRIVVSFLNKDGREKKIIDWNTKDGSFRTGVWMGKIQQD